MLTARLARLRRVPIDLLSLAISRKFVDVRGFGSGCLRVVAEALRDLRTARARWISQLNTLYGEVSAFGGDDL
jgi:hypothetical protein